MARPAVLTGTVFLCITGLILLLYAPFRALPLSKRQSAGEILPSAATSQAQENGDYLVGVGKADITG